MSVYDKLLLATDFSKSSTMATRAAARLAEHFAAPLIVAHVFDSTPFRFSFPSKDMGKQLAAAAIKELNRYCTEHLDDLSNVIEKAVDAESAPEAIGAIVDADSVDLCVVGTHGRTGLARLLIGSVAENIVRRVHCDVLTVRPGTGADWRPKKILAPTDFSEGSQRAADRALLLAESFDAEIVVAHVFDPSLPVPSSRPGSAFLDEKEIASELREQLGKMHAEDLAGSERVSTSLIASSDGHAEGIVAYARDNDIDVIVVGSHGRGALTRFLIGSVAERVVRSAGCPVLTARSPAEPQQDS